MIPIKMYVYLACIGAIFFAGFQVATWKHDAAMLALKEQIEEERGKISDAQYEIESLNVKVTELQEIKHEEVVREVIKYKPTGTMSNEWVRIHDCATVQATGEATCQPDAEATGESYTDQEALFVVSANYNKCLEQLTKFTGLQDWVNALYIVPSD